MESELRKCLRLKHRNFGSCLSEEEDLSCAGSAAEFDDPCESLSTQHICDSVIKGKDSYGFLKCKIKKCISYSWNTHYYRKDITENSYLSWDLIKYLVSVQYKQQQVHFLWVSSLKRLRGEKLKHLFSVVLCSQGAMSRCWDAMFKSSV